MLSENEPSELAIPIGAFRVQTHWVKANFWPFISRPKKNVPCTIGAKLVAPRCRKLGCDFPIPITQRYNTTLHSAKVNVFRPFTLHTPYLYYMASVSSFLLPIVCFREKCTSCKKKRLVV